MKKPFILYHWSPSSRRKSIERHGLVTGKPHVTHSKGGWQANYLCFADSPSMAWGLSACMSHEHGDWDLWMTWSNSLVGRKRLVRWDGVEPVEYRTSANVPKRSIWFVGTRHRDPKKRK